MNEDPAAAAMAAAAAAHAPVLLDEVVAALAPARGGVYLDGTFGAGGYARALLEGGATRVIGLDRDPTALAAARPWAEALYPGRLTLLEARFSTLDHHASAPLAGVALDLGVSSMQLDRPERGFSFLRDGPLDMRMGADGETAADLVARLEESALADILFHYGEERASRRIARAIVTARAEAPIETTLRLAEIVASALPRPKPGQPHAATRSFQALRIAVNRELDELTAGLEAAERALGPEGVLAVVSFHSLEDRIVKRFVLERAGRTPNASRHEPAPREPELNERRPSFRIVKGPITPGEAELARNPRARSAKLRIAIRTDAPAPPPERSNRR